MKTNSHPHVTVLMSVYNGERYLESSVESILGQTYQNFEFLILDDASTDSTADVIRRYAAQDSRIISVRNKHNLGLTRSLNRGLQFAKGNYIARQDADDISLPHRLEVQVPYLDAHPECVLVAGQCEFMDSEGNLVSRSLADQESFAVAWHLLYCNYVVAHSVVLIRQQTLRAVGGYRESFPVSQDYELYSRLSKMGEIVNLPEYLLRNRNRHNESITVKHAEEQDALSLQISQQSISELIGKDVSFDQIRSIRSFFNQDYARLRAVDTLDKQLGSLYRSFSKRCRNGTSRPAATYVRRLIGKRYLRWSAFVKGRQIFLKGFLALKGFLWYPKFFLLPDLLRFLKKGGFPVGS